jgi:hypothetical protein
LLMSLNTLPDGRYMLLCVSYACVCFPVYSRFSSHLHQPVRALRPCMPAGVACFGLPTRERYSACSVLKTTSGPAVEVRSAYYHHHHRQPSVDQRLVHRC